MSKSMLTKFSLTILSCCFLFFFNTLESQAQAYTKIGKYRHYIDIEEDSHFKKYNIGHTKERYKKMQNFSEGFILIFIPSKGKYAYMDSRSYVIIPKQYAEYGFFREGRAKVKDYRGKWGYINPKMEEVIATKYDEVGFFKDGLAKVKKYGRSQTIDESGACIFNCY